MPYWPNIPWIKCLIDVLEWIKCLCCSVVQLCPGLCNSMDCSMPGLSVHCCLWCLLKLMSIESVMPSNHLILCCPLLLLPSNFPSTGVFSNDRIISSSGQSIGAPTTVLLLNTQDWFPLGLTGLIFLQSKGLSRVFSNYTFQKHHFFRSQLSLYSNSL